MKYEKMKYRKMRYRKVQASLLGIVTLCAVTGCGKGKEAKDAETESNTEALEHAAVSTVTLTEGKYSEEKLRDTWDEESAVCLKLEKDEILSRRSQMSGSGMQKERRYRILAETALRLKQVR